MKSIVTHIASAIALVLIAHTSLADCAADINAADARRLYQEAIQLEASGKLWDSLLKYHAAQAYVCDDGGNPVAKQALSKAITLGSQQGKIEEQKGNLFNDGKPAGAFQWYEKGAQFAAADRVLIAALKKTPTNMDLSAVAQAHFNIRGKDYFSGNNEMAITASGGYTLDKSLDRYAASVPPANIERLLTSYQTLLPDNYLQALAKLEQEKDALQPGDIAGVMTLHQASTQFQQQWKSDRIEDVRRAFSDAQSWTQQIRDHQEAEMLRAKIDEARLQHADRIYASYSGMPKLMESALDIYRQQEKSARIKSFEQKARGYAQQAMAAKQYRRASDFYGLIGDYENEQRARAQMEAQQAELAQNAQMGAAGQLAEMQKMYSDPNKIQELQKQAQAMQEQMEEQRKKGASAEYQKETDALEDELGL